MQFNSIEFLLFCPIVFFLYWALRSYLKIQNLFVFVVSYFFYGWWNWKLLYLIALTTVLSYTSGVLLEYYSNRCCPICKKTVLVANVVINLLILGVFKYYNFFIFNLIDVFEQIGVSIELNTLNLILPVGISFYTFQVLSYTIDVYRRQIKATKDLIAFAAYVSFFPQLVAGPIERATNLLPQFLVKRVFSYEKAVEGLRQILWGFFMKIVVADNCASMVNLIFDHYLDANWLMLLMGAIFFTFQIYGDFAGYSNIAIGCSQLFGFSLMENFKCPYFSYNIPEFWRRWHISLNTWFRDYVYIPLGGSRGNRFQWIRNTMLVFGVSGLWHGANWTYVIWGLYHGLFTILQRKWINRNFLSMFLTFMIVVVGWIFFRASSISQAFDYIRCMVSLKDGLGIRELGGSVVILYCTITFIVLLMLSEGRGLIHSYPKIMEIRNRTIRWGIYLGLVFVLLLFPGKSETFIYFQF